jgi:hypothetical protein
MGIRGRKSIAQQSTTGLVVPRPDPPKDLNGAEALEWIQVVASMPPTYFAGSHYSLLAQLCRVTVTSRHTSQLIATFLKQKKTDIKQYCRLLGVQRQETASIIRLMQSMRLTHQATYRADSAKTRPRASLAPFIINGGSKKPWQGA